MNSTLSPDRVMFLESMGCRILPNTPEPKHERVKKYTRRVPGRGSRYASPEEARAARKEYHRQWQADNRERLKLMRLSATQ